MYMYESSEGYVPHIKAAYTFYTAEVACVCVYTCLREGGRKRVSVCVCVCVRVCIGVLCLE